MNKNHNNSDERERHVFLCGVWLKWKLYGKLFGRCRCVCLLITEKKNETKKKTNKQTIIKHNKIESDRNRQRTGEPNTHELMMMMVMMQLCKASRRQHIFEAHIDIQSQLRPRVNMNNSRHIIIECTNENWYPLSK